MSEGLHGEHVGVAVSSERFVAGSEHFGPHDIVAQLEAMKSLRQKLSDRPKRRRR